MHQLRYYNFEKEVLRFQNSRIISMIPGFMKQFRKTIHPLILYYMCSIARNFHFHDDMIYYSQNKIIKEKFHKNMRPCMKYKLNGDSQFVWVYVYLAYEL